MKNTLQLIHIPISILDASHVIVKKLEITKKNELIASYQKTKDFLTQSI